MNLQLRLILASVERAVRATLRRERSWALAPSFQARFHSPQAQAECARELIARFDEQSFLGCWHASDRGMTARAAHCLAVVLAAPLRRGFRAFATMRDSILKYRHFKK